MEVLYTVFHQVGAAVHKDPEFQEKLVRYSQVAFHVDSADHNRLEAIAYEEKVRLVINSKRYI